MAYCGQGMTLPSRWDAGNYALMRMAPVALYAPGDDDTLARHAAAQAHITRPEG